MGEECALERRSDAARDSGGIGGLRERGPLHPHVWRHRPRQQVHPRADGLHPVGSRASVAGARARRIGRRILLLGLLGQRPTLPAGPCSRCHAEASSSAACRDIGNDRTVGVGSFPYG